MKRINIIIWMRWSPIHCENRRCCSGWCSTSTLGVRGRSSSTSRSTFPQESRCSQTVGHIAVKSCRIRLKSYLRWLSSSNTFHVLFLFLPRHLPRLCFFLLSPPGENHFHAWSRLEILFQQLTFFGYASSSSLVLFPESFTMIRK